MASKKEKNVIQIIFGTEVHVKTPQIYQWDKGQFIKFLDVDDGVEVQFSNEKNNETKNKVIENGQVEIPGILLEENSPITAYVKFIDNNSETTIKTVYIPVKSRTKPANYVEPEDEQSFREYVEEKVTEAQVLVKGFDEKVIASENEINSLTKSKLIEANNAINELTAAKMGDIDSLTVAKMGDISTLTNAKLEDINNTTSAQIDTINRVANQNTKSGTEAVATAAQAQIGGINTVAAAQKEGITNTTQGKIADINKIATSQIDAINKTAQAQSSALSKQAERIMINLGIKAGKIDGITYTTTDDLEISSQYKFISFGYITWGNGGSELLPFIPLSVKLYKVKNGEVIESFNTISSNTYYDVSDCDAIRLDTVFQGGSGVKFSLDYALSRY